MHSECQDQQASAKCVPSECHFEDIEGTQGEHFEDILGTQGRHIPGGEAC